MVLTKRAVFTALLHDPQLGIHLLRLVTGRLLQNAGAEPFLPADEASPRPADERFAGGCFPALFGRNGKRAAIAALGVAPILALVFQPLNMILQRDGTLTTWLNIATAPIDGTIKDFDVRVGDIVEGTPVVARIVDDSADRSGVIRAREAVRRAEAKLAELSRYRDRVAKLAAEWTERKAHYAAGFRRDLDLEIADRETPRIGQGTRRIGLSTGAAAAHLERVRRCLARRCRRRSRQFPAGASVADRDGKGARSRPRAAQAGRPGYISPGGWERTGMVVALDR